MLGLFFQGSSHRNQPAFIHAVRHHIGYNGSAGGQSAGLVQHHCIDAVEHFQCSCIFKQHTHLRATADTHHNRHRSRQTQGAGAGDHQHGNSSRQRKFQPSVTEHPYRKSYDCNGHHHGHKYAGNSVGQTGNGRFGAARVLHQPDNLGQCGILAHFFRPEL